jgi:Domain of unknown function (DUF4832)
MMTRLQLSRTLYSFGLLLLSACTLAPTIELETQAIITPIEIPLSASELSNPLRGYYDWQGYGVTPPGLQFPEFYKRYLWDELETSKGVYDFTVIKNDLATAKVRGQKFAFRIMAIDSFGRSPEGDDEIGIPLYMTTEVPGDYCGYNSEYIKTEWEVDRVWVPDWNSQAFLNRARALVNALGRAFDGKPEIAYYDMGVYGHWGEWHAWPFENCATAGEASDATKHAIIDMQLAAFPKSRIVMNSGASNSDAFAYALNQSPRIGVRIDSFNWPWFDQQIEENATKKALLDSRWKTAPIIVEFGGSFNPEDSQDFSLAQAQVKRWHIASVANGNSYSWDNFTQTQKDNFLMAGKLSGYRVVPREFRYPNGVSRDTSFRLISKWSNTGVTPLYEKFIVRYELRPKGQSTVAWRGNSGLELQTLLPTLNAQGTDTPKTVTDVFVFPQTLTPGSYTLSLVILDPTGYRSPLALAVEGRKSSGRYSIGDVTLR